MHESSLGSLATVAERRTEIIGEPRSARNSPALRKPGVGVRAPVISRPASSARRLRVHARIRGNGVAPSRGAAVDAYPRLRAIKNVALARRLGRGQQLERPGAAVAAELLNFRLTLCLPMVL